ncbi:MAG: hypothetical protein KF788_00325 [Piscinibacter sp.]|nr:hypothetical protein [Piscinibacter sp.]
MKKPLVLYSPWHLSSSDTMPPLGEFGWRFLAEGDSWFSIGALNPAKNSNLLFEMEFERSACAVNCASPGDTLRRMSQINTDRNYVALLRGKTARLWDGLLLSCGGNDLIDALGVHGAGIPQDKRLLLEAAEWGDAALGPRRYLSDAGWQTFRTYLAANLELMIGLRDSGPSRGAPIFLHGYSVPMPRPAGAGLGAGPWLLPAVQAYAIPEADYAGVARLLIERLAALLADCAADSARFPNLHFFDTTQIALDPALPGTEGESGDWINEIHLTWRGCAKLAVPWAAAIEQVLTA